MYVLYGWAASQGEAMRTEADDYRIRVPMVEPGTYAFCSLDNRERAAAIRTGQGTFKNCATAIAAPFGEVSLTLPLP